MQINLAAPPTMRSLAIVGAHVGIEQHTKSMRCPLSTARCTIGCVCSPHAEKVSTIRLDT